MLRILILHYGTPNVTGHTTILFENMLPLLRTRTKVHTTWFVYSSKKSDFPSQNDPDTTVLHIQDYKNAIEVIQEVKPDMIYLTPGWSIPDYAFVLAGRQMNIPVVGSDGGADLYGLVSRKEYLKSNIVKFFHSSAPTDFGGQKRFLGRGRFFIYKHLFFFRTLKALKMSRLKIFQNFLILLRAYLGLGHRGDDPRFACTLLFLEKESRVEPLVKAGFERSSLVVTGNPTYDLIFQKLQKFKQSTKKSDKIRVLLLTIDLSGQGGNWSKKRRDSMIKEIVEEIYKYKDSMSIIVKIHPSNEILSEYKEIISSIDTTIPIYQEGDIVEFIENADVIISSATSTGLVCALIARKPIIIYNAFNVRNDFFLESELVSECKNVSEIIPNIHQVLHPDPSTVKKIDEHIGEFIYNLDGRSCERMSNAIMELLRDKYQN